MNQRFGLFAALVTAVSTLSSLAGEPAQPTTGPVYDNAARQRRPTGVTYRVRCLPHARVHVDGRLDEPEWSRANVERHFVFPWSKAEAPATEFLAFCDDKYLYFAFRAEDADIFVLDKLRDKEDAVFEDRVEMILSCDAEMNKYFCFEIDSRGRTFDYQASYYRQFDPKWKCKGLETAASPLEKGYAVEGRIPLATLTEMGFPRLVPGERIFCGLYRAEFSHDRSGKPVVQRETIHNHGRKLAGPPPIEAWMSWIDPKTPEPDFHVPSSLGWLEIVE